MARIKTYNIDTLLSDNDKVIGTDVDSFNQTKNYKLSDIRSYVNAGLSPEVGGTLKVFEIEYDGELTTVSSVVNLLNPTYTIARYEVLFIRINNQRYVCKLQDVTVGLGETPTTEGDFIFLSNIEGPAGANGSIWRNGTGVPSNDLGANGDYYLNDANGDVYLKATGVYTIVANIKGEDGVSVVANGLSISVTGTGTEADPYTPNLVNLQKTVSSFPYTLTSGDDKYTIFIDNEDSNVAINIPTGLVSNFTASFIQVGTGDASINNNVGVNLEHPSTLQNIIKGQYYGVMLEKEIATENYYLIGGLKLS
jgi:hypothetical protein